MDSAIVTDALAHRRQSLLARALCRARRISRAHPRGDACGSPRCRSPMSARPTNGNRRSRPPAAPALLREHYQEANEETVTDFLAFSTDNPSSIRNCFEAARTNARAVRTALTSEMWDAINGAWLELKRCGNGPRSREEFARFLRWVQEIVAALRRLGLPHHAAQRRLLVLAARRLYRARRQHRAHPRREISPAAAGPSTSAARSTITNGPRSCARSRRSPPITGSIARASSRGWSPTC